MPDLNTANPAVLRELYQILGFWLAMGVDGFRMDSLPLMVEEIAEDHGAAGSHTFLRELRTFIAWRNGSAALVGEANLPVEQLGEYFGEAGAEQMQALFDFLTCAGMWRALATGQAGPLIEQLRRRPVPPSAGQYLTYLRHHDELTFEHVLTEQQAEQVFAAFAPSTEHRAYDRGIRRRLAPMLYGDPARIPLALSLLFAMPGTPLPVAAPDPPHVKDRRWSSAPTGPATKH